MRDIKPKLLSDIDIAEIAALEEIRQVYSADDPAQMVDWLKSHICSVKFEHVPGSLGDEGDLYVLIHDAVDEAITIRRTRDGSLEVAD